MTTPTAPTWAGIDPRSNTGQCVRCKGPALASIYHHDGYWAECQTCGWAWRVADNRRQAMTLADNRENCCLACDKPLPDGRSFCGATCWMAYLAPVG